MARKKIVRKKIRRQALSIDAYKDGSFPDYKDSGLDRFLTERGKIIPRSRTSVSSMCQRRLSRAIKQARYLGLLPYIVRK